jgi:hypothetical protein
MEWVIRQFLVSVRLHHQIAALSADDGVAIWRGARAELETELPGSAGAVIDDDVLT